MKLNKSEFLLDYWKSKKMFMFYFVLVFLIFLLLLIGWFGPPQQDLTEDKNTISQKESQIDLEILNLDRLNQFIFVDSFFESEESKEITDQVKFNVTLHGSNSNEINSTTKWTYISESEHTRKISCQPKSNCSKHTMVYVPFIHYKNYQIVVGYDLTESKHNFSNIYLEKNQKRSFKKFYLPKFIPLIIMYVTFLIQYVWNRVHEHDDPQYESINDIPAYMTVKILFWVSYSVYIVWLIYSSVLRIGNYLPKLRNTTLEFTASFSILNVAFIMLSYAYLPNNSTIGDLKDSAPQELIEEQTDDTGPYKSDLQISQNDISLDDNSEI
ncbi:transmembrane protein [Anaeramoeba flamelloides]|uniref:Transmembrane protein n=1 Tax=Anaeramoeba flamelloides TaxID=1746091 RepID=A0ABQ8YPN1_9EUKA|nr:transmembrane protein [Anaeramoeba flamelloides]